MRLFLYKLKLTWYLAIFVIQLGANYSNKTKPILLGVFIIIILTAISIISLLTNSTKPKEIIIKSNTIPVNKEVFLYSQMTKQELEDQLEYWKKIEEKQPNSRDILLNLSQLYSALEDKELSKSYFEKAYTIDPNKPELKF